MASMTIAQALASKLTGIAVVDTPANIAAAASNTALVARVKSFSLNANGTSTVLQATQIATLAAKFSRGSYTYTIRDSVAALSGMGVAAAAIATATTVLDTATALLAAATSSVVLHATSTLMSVSASLSLANLIKLEALPAFSVLAGQSITLTDSAANLLALTAAQNRPSIKAFQVSVTSAITIANAQALLALPGFSVVGGVTLSVSGSVAAMTTVSAIATVPKIAAVAGTTVKVSDSLSNLLTSIATLASMAQSTTKLTVTEIDSGTGNVSQLAGLAPLAGRFSVLPGHTLTLVDTASNLLAASPTVTSLAQVTHLSQTENVSAANLAHLTALAGFAPGSGNQLTVTDTLAALNGLSSGQRAIATQVVVQDSVANLASAGSLPSGTDSILAQFDGTQYTAAQAVHVGAFATGGVTLSLVASGTATSMTIADKLQVLADDAAQINALATRGQLTLSPTDSNVALGVQSIIALESLTGITLASYGVGASDSGAAITTNAASLFGHGLASITVASGMFSGTLAQLLDPTLHFAGASSPFTLSLVSAFTLGDVAAATAQLASNATVSAAQLIALSVLPGFSVAGGVTLLVRDTIADLVNAAAVVGSYATAIAVTDPSTAVVTAAAATSLAQLGSTVGANNFAIAGHPVTISDSAAALTDAANAAGVALATSLTLASSSVVTAGQAIQLVAFGLAFSLAGNALTVIDSAAALATLANTQGAVTAVNDWGGQVLLSASVVQSVAATQRLQLFTGFSVGSHSLTISDTAANLLANAASVALASAVELSASGVVTVAGAASLAAMHGFSTNSMALTIADTPAHLAAMGGTLAALATGERLVASTVDNAADYTISATQFATLQALSGLSMSGFTGTVTVSDTADALAVVASGSLSFGSLLFRTALALSADATVAATEATTLADFPRFSLASHALNIRDAPGALLSPGAADGVAAATSVGINAPAQVSAAIAASLAALHNFAVDANPLTILDTPANLAAASVSALAIAASVQVAPSYNNPIGDYTVTAGQFTTMAGLANLSFAGFSGTITVTDTADNLYGLATSFAGAAIGSTLLLARAAMTSSLSADATVSAAELNGLASLPMLALNGHTLTVADTVSNLLLASNASGEALADHVAVDISATVTAAAASALAALPNVTLGNGVTLTVQDSVANLLALSGAAQALATAELLPVSASVVVTAAQSAALYNLGHFSNTGATLTVNDTIANLNAGGNSGWNIPATSYVVTDTVANIVAVELSARIAFASSVTLAGGADIDAATAETLDGIATFTRGSALLTVTDTAADIAAHATAILAVASSARIDATAPITAAQADSLVALSTASKLGFSGGVTLWVEDTYSALIDEANAAGVALATTVTVLDTVANVLTATAHDWGSIVPYYALSGGGSVTGAQAAMLAALGSHFSINGQTLVMADTADGVVSHAAALVALDIPAQVSDTTAHVIADTAGLVARGDRLMLVTLTDSTPLTATQADGLHYLASVLAGDTLTVTDTAAAVSGNLANLLALGAHLGTVNVTDTAADVNAADTGGSPIQTLGSLLHITLTDAAPLLAATAAALAPVMSYLDGGTSIRVTDTGANIAAQSASLAALGSKLGTVALSDGTTVNAAVAAGLAAIDTHFGLAVTLDVVDTAAALVGAGTALGTLRTDGRINSIVAPNETAAHVVTYAGGLAALGATATISDSAAHVLAALDSLEPLSTGGGILTAIALTDSPIVLTLTVNTLATDTDALALITTSYGITVSDTAAHIQADLVSGSSTIVAHLADVSSIVASDNGGISLTQAQALATGVADSFSSAMARFSGGAFTVTGVDVAHVNAIAGLAVAPASMAVSDTAADIQADLISGSSALLAHRTLITGIVVSDSGTITLTDTQALAAHVDDGAGSAFSLISGGALVVTGVTVAHVDAIVALGVPPQSFAMSDTAAHIQADLALGDSSHILVHRGLISGITVSDSGTITLTEAQVLATGVDDGSGSAASKLSGGMLAVSAVLAADIGTIAALPVAPASIAVSDTAAHIQADLVSGTSAILAQLGLVSAIAINDAGTISLTVAQVTAAGVDDSAGAALTKLSGGVFVVTGVALADFTSILALTVQPDSVAVSDTAAHIRSDVLSGSSVLLANPALVAGIAVSDAGTISLTVAQITAGGVDDGAGSVFGKTTGGTLAVTGATVADFTALDALTRHPDSVAVSDSAADVQADLIAGSPVLLAHVSGLASVAITDGGTTALALTVEQLAADAAVLALLTTPFDIAISDTVAHVQSDLTGGSSTLLAHIAALVGITLTDGGTPTITLTVDQLAADVAVLSLISAHSLTVSDTAGHVQSDLAAGAASTLLANIGLVASVALTDGTTITLTEAQATYGGVATAMHKIGDLTSFVVTGATVAQIATVLGLGVTGTSIAILDSATDVQGDLNGGSSVLLAHTSAIGSITLTDNSPPTLSLTVAALAADAAVLARVVSTYHIAVSDSVENVQTDLTGESSTLVAHAGSLGSITLTDGGTPTIALTVATIQAAQSVLSLIVSSFHVSISDTAADVQGDLTGGSSALLALASQLSTIALTDGSPPTLTLNVAQLAADASVLALIGSSYFVAVSDTAAAVQSDLTAGVSSTILANLGRLTGVALPGSSSITLTEAEAVHAGVATVLRETTGLASFVVTGATVAQIAAVLALSVSNTTINVSDTAADIQTDLTGGSSVLLAHTAAVGSITLSDSLVPTLTLAVGDLVADGTVLGLIGSTYHLVVDDAAANVQTDLAAGAASTILAHIAALTGITLPDSSTITLTEAQATYGGVATVLKEAAGLTGLVVTGATVAQIATVLALGVTGTSMTISDTAADVQSDLTGGSSVLLGYVSAITGITLTDSPATLTLSIAQLAADASVLTLIGSSYHIVVSDTAANVQSDLAAGASSTILAHSSALTGITLPGGSTITLTATQAAYPGVGAALAEATGLTSLVVSSTTVAQLPAVYALGISGTHIAIRDTAANVLSDMTGAGSLLADLASISTITTTDVGGSQTFTVTVAQLSAQKTVLAKISPGYLLAINDSATNVQNDLALGATSAIVVAHTHISSSTLSGTHTITLTEAQVTASFVAGFLRISSGLTSLVVTGSTVAQIPTVVGLSVAGTSIGVSDSAANVQGDLTGGSSKLYANRAAIGSITLTDSGTPTITLSVAQLTTDASVLSLIGSSYNLVVSDTAAHVQADLAAGVSSTILAHLGTLTGVTLPASSTITLTEAQATYTGVAATLIKTTDLSSFVVTGATVAQVTTVLALGVANTTININDTAADVQGDLTGGSSVLLAHTSAIGSITLTDTPAPTLTLAISDLTADGSVLGLIGSTYYLVVNDTAAHVQSDLAAGASSNILAHSAALTGITLPGGSTITLTATEATHSGVGSALAVATGLTSFVVTGATVAQVATIVGLGITGTTIAVYDSASDVQGDLAGGASSLVANVTSISGIALSDGGTPTITLNIAQLAADTTVLSLISASHNLAIADIASNMQSDLANGASSTLLTNLGMIAFVNLTGSSHTITLTEAQATFTDVDTVLNELSGLTSFVVTGATVAQITTILSLGVSGTTIDVTDTAAHVQSDLTGASVLLAQAGVLGSITLTDTPAPTLTFAVSDLAADGAVLGLIGSTYHLVVNDTAGHVQSDLAAGASSNILAHSAALTGITLPGGSTITLTAAQALHSGVGTALAVATGLTSFVVTGAAVAQVATVLALGITGTTIAVSDSVAQVQGDLTGGASALLPHAGVITAIALNDGGTPTITLSVAQVVADAAVLALLSAHDLAIADTATNVQADLAAGVASTILGTTISGITLAANSSITLTEAQATYTGVAAALNMATGLTGFVVTGATIAQITAVLALGVTGTTIAVSASAAEVAGDLAGSAVLLAHVSALSSIALSDTGTPTIALTVAGLVADTSVLALITSPYDVSVSDTAANVQADLTGGASKLLANVAHLGGIALTDGGTPPLSLTIAQVTANSAVLALISSSYTITVGDTAADVQSDLTSGSSGLVACVGHIGIITLTDGGTPTITLSVAQLATDGAVLALIGSSHDLVINDTAANVRVDLAAGVSSTILANLGAITGIALSSGHLISLTEAQATYAGVATALGKMTGLTTFAVTGTTIAQIATVIALGITGTSISVSDTVANVQSDLTGGTPTLIADLGSLHTITLSDGSTPTITLDVAQLAADDTVLGLVVSTYHLAVSDTAANVQTDLAAGASSAILAHSGVLSGVTLTAGHTITLTEAQAIYSGVAAVLTATSSLTSFVVTGVTVAQVATVVALGVSGTSISLSDTAAHVQSDLTGGSSVLLADVTHIGTIALSDGGTPTITLTVAQLAADASVLALIGSSYHIAISDTAAHVQSDLALGASSTILAGLATISTIALTSGTAIILTSAQAQYAGVDNSGSSAVAKMTNLTSLVVTDVLVADITTVLTGLNVTPTMVSLLDTAAHITSDFSGAGLIATYQSAITAVRTTETTLNATTATILYNGLHGITTFDESGLTVTDAAAALLTAAPAMLAAALTVTMSNNPAGLTAAQATTLSGILHGVLGNSQTMGVADTLTNLLSGSNTAGINLATSVTLSGATTATAAQATALVALHAWTAGPAITVQDTVANLLNASYTSGINAASTVELNGSYSVVAATLTALAALHDYAAGPFSLTVTGSVSDVLALSQAALGFTALVSVTDTTASLVANLAALQAAIPGHSHTLAITLSDPSALSIVTTALTYATDAATYGAISNAGVIKVTGDAAGLAAIATALAANAAVGEVDVTDSAANILANLTALESIGSAFRSATLTDSSISASEVASLLAIPNLITTGLTISDTGTQIAAAILADGISAINAFNVQLSQDSIIAAADAVQLELLTSFSKNGHHLYVWDTASHLTDSVDGYLAAVRAGIIDGVYLKAAGHTATITASLASSLLSISAFNRNDPPILAGGDGTANTLIVQDTAAHIEAVFSSLVTNRAALSSIVVSASATVTDAVFGDLLTLGAIMDSGKALTVRDTAANLIANAAGQTAGTPSIVPTSWQISGSAAVTPAGAILLAGLPGFSIGAYTLTLTTDATISVANANTLGGLSTSLALSSHHLYVAGSVATMTTGPGLSSNAKLIVTPQITDTFANIATLTTGSGLLGGTIAITDSEAISVGQASSFLALLGGSGIPVANVSFASHIQSVTDTLSNIQTLTSSSGWTTNATVHTDFSLVVADTVANLVNTSNATALAAMAGTTLSGNQTVLAAAAESLFAMENTIHFSKGSFTLTIQDTAANLLNAANSDGVALADVLQLSADGTVAAADAETLLTNSRFHLNHILTVSDSSSNLLDGILSGDISGSAYSASVVVELGAPETLDAGTAHALVNLPGFTNNGDLSIADGASYLLNAANHAAEVAATSVTLAGDETVSTATAAKLAALPHFTLGSNVLHLASNDYADAATLVAIADFGGGFDHNGFTVTMTQDALALTPTEYTALQSDGVVLNGHALSALATGVSVTSASGTVHVSGTGVSGATLNVYSASGTSLSHTSSVAASFTANAAEGSIGNGVVVTETVGASAATSESAPIIALEQTVLTTAVITTDSATFATSGAVQVGTNQYVDIYTTATVTGHTATPVLVYDPSAYTLSLDVNGHAPVVLATLGTATHPTALTAAEIFIQHFS